MTNFEQELETLLDEVNGAQEVTPAPAAEPAVTPTPAEPTQTPEPTTPVVENNEGEPVTPTPEEDVNLAEALAELNKTPEETKESMIVKRLMAKYGRSEDELLDMLAESEADDLMKQHGIPEGTDPKIAKEMLELKEQVRKNNEVAARQQKTTQTLDLANELISGTDATNKQVVDYIKENFKEGYLENPDALAMFKKIAIMDLEKLNVKGGELDSTNPIGGNDPSLAGRQFNNDPAAMIADLNSKLNSADFSFNE